MAGRGPAPGANPNRKRADQRRHRGKTVDSFDDLPAEGYDGPFPPLPDAYSAEIVDTDEEGKKVRDIVERDFLPRTKLWYETWARSPMAVRFTQVDWMRLQDIAPLKDRYYRESTEKLASELRLQESLFGATVLDRQRLGVKVAASPQEENTPVEDVPFLRVVRDAAA